MKRCAYIVTFVLALMLASCSSARKSVSYYDDIYDSGFSEGYELSEYFILQELANTLIPAGTCHHVLLEEAFTWKGVPYVYGGHSKKGTDCSGFVMEVYRNAFGIDIPRNSAKQAQACLSVGRKDLEVGDLVFFHGGSKGKVSHVGIYIGDGMIIHASSSRGVIVSDLSHQYYDNHYHSAGRVPALKKLVDKERKKK